MKTFKILIVLLCLICILCNSVFAVDVVLDVSYDIDYLEDVVKTYNGDDVTITEFLNDSSNEVKNEKYTFFNNVGKVLDDYPNDNLKKAMEIRELTDDLKFKCGILDVKFQGGRSYDDYAIRVVSTIDDTSDDYVTEGFEISIINPNSKVKPTVNDFDTDCIIENLEYKKDGIPYTKSASKLFCPDSEYLFTYTIIGIPADVIDDGYKITVRAYVEDDKGNRIYGVKKTRKIKEIIDSIS